VAHAALADLIRERQPCVVLTGAGVSTESGIPDFRSATGIWADIDAFEVASIRAFERDPVRVWSFYRERIHLLRDAEPNAAHLALAELERRGLVQAVVTQNIDTLHTRAGSRDVVEVHGSIRSAVCLGCLWTEPADAVLAQLVESPTPTCPHCGLPLEARAFAIVNRGPTALDQQAILKVDAAGQTSSEEPTTRTRPAPRASTVARSIAAAGQELSEEDHAGLEHGTAGETLAAVVAAL